MAYIRTHETTERETPVFVAHVRGELVAQSFWCGLRGPQPQHVIPAGRDDAASVGTERDTGHVVGMPGERVGDGLAGIGVPQPHRVVATTTDQPVPVGAERHTRHLLAMPF